MEIVHTLELIIPKIHQQLFQKRIHSLDALYKVIAQEGKYFPLKELDFF